MTYSETILLGIPSGVVSAFLVWVTITTWTSIFTPWLRKQIYRGVEIQGEWTSVVMRNRDGNEINDMIDAVETVSYIFNIENQNGHVIKGWFSQIYKNNNEVESQGRYKVVGQIMDGMVMATLSPDNKNKSTFGTLLMYVICSGGKLDGKFTYKGAKTNKINVIDIKLDKRL